MRESLFSGCWGCSIKSNLSSAVDERLGVGVKVPGSGRLTMPKAWWLQPAGTQSQAGICLVNKLVPQQIEHQLNISICLSSPGTGPIGFRLPVLCHGIYWSGTPIWTRVGQQNNFMTPFQNNIEIMLGFCLKMVSCLDI